MAEDLAGVAVDSAEEEVPVEAAVDSAAAAAVGSVGVKPAEAVAGSAAAE